MRFRRIPGQPTVTCCGRCLGTDLACGLRTVAAPGSASPPTPGYIGKPATIVGSGSITGTAGDDVIVGSADTDTIDGKDGNDLICGLAGDDVLVGGLGNDQVDGGDDNDRLVSDLSAGGWQHRDPIRNRVTPSAETTTGSSAATGTTSSPGTLRPERARHRRWQRPDLRR